MRSLRALEVTVTVTVTAALLLAAAFVPGPARAADAVDVTYDLSDTTVEVLQGFNFQNVAFVSNDDSINGTVAGSMKVRYTSSSQSSMPIESGPASLLLFNLTMPDFTLQRFMSSGTKNPYTVVYPLFSGSFHWQLGGGPLVGNLTSGGALTGLSGTLHLTGTAKCLFPYPYSAACIQYAGIPGGVTAQINRYYSGPFTFAGSVGPYGGAQSTRHTVTGQAPVSLKQGFVFALSSGLTHNGYGGAQLVGREVLREAEGHDPKVIPEPGTLLLIGSGIAGLVLVGRASRRG